MSIWTTGPLLHYAQELDLFPDSKEFVDMPMKSGVEIPEDMISEILFDLERALPIEEKRARLLNFITTHFDPAGSELLPHTPEDHKPFHMVPLSVCMRASELHGFCECLHERWLTLCRRVSDDVRQEPQRYSLLYKPHPIIIPGGRFREPYYWDSYWIIKGLLASSMIDTAKGMVRNFIHDVQLHGMVPNGGRVYYLTRSQPPMLTEMAMAIFDVEQDVAWLKETVPWLDVEYRYWMGPVHCLTIQANDGTTKYNLNRYNAQSDEPRPESYREDLKTAAGLSAEQRRDIFQHLASAAESGWDFSSRWMVDEIGLEHVRTSAFIPVDLNAILYKTETRLCEAHALLASSEASQRYEEASLRRRKAMMDLLFDPIAHRWRDRVLPNKHDVMCNEFTLRWSDGVHLSDWAAPLWAQIPSGEDTPLLEQVIESYCSSGLRGTCGTMTTLKETSEQWDAPNAWPPLQDMLIQGLHAYSRVPRAQTLAHQLAQEWIRNCFQTWVDSHQSIEHRVMHEKYNARSEGVGGGGGEYEPQVGFGWTNGVILSLLQTFPQS